MDEFSIIPNDDSGTSSSATPGAIPGRNGGTLQPWQPGQSGNPKGMKPGTLHFSTIMRQLLNEKVVVSINDKNYEMTRAQSLMLEKIRLATNSQFDNVRLRAIMDIEDRVDGKPIPLLPDWQHDDDDGVVFYIPNEHSRKRKIEQ